MLIDNLEGCLFAEGVNRIRADTQALLHFALDNLARGQNRLEIQARERFKRVQSLSRKQPAGRDLDRPVLPPERQQLLLQQNAGGKERQKLSIRLDVIQRCIRQPVFLREPAKNVLFSERA